ncbi:hypothetical protein COCC4DRAFT_77920 [Bipolaris maydis ATCC 48331]|uniref:Uncharacterized protein n=2 Tax=Cochliobolus heterostrophus TaxID=5016 RepID=M2UPU6_COCH5|nr:uncharacterized protein COCC4DRAFT_77920 [Bipolaris maydis ATCC 48331]EMD89948.1 hypothetical protein COCHEDRAFT_1178094 [Bipolaris maydis C5]KAH7563208.1 hypothetical protein BM1_00255 [Bipolaris maydis]ENI09840.1 hypothetical protein COCC4DRAFT_77920 [Bipolaris maydis ATCC 48331]KAJ5025368.1 hypothetical protein J3E73DRAFT_49344 [Bipolaris maydis]KAJ6196884.1 hypothetical protein J3E72DRAFT_47301 [Bipolaris maydis]
MVCTPITIDKGHTITPLNSPPVPLVSPSKNPPSPSTKSPRNPVNQHWVQAQQRKIFIHHLKQWSMGHDSSAHFQGKLSLLPPDPRRREDLDLGKSVQCVLTDSSFKDCSKKIVVRLFSPQMGKRKSRKPCMIRQAQRGDMNPFESREAFTEWEEGMCPFTFAEEDMTQPTSQVKSISPSNYYKLVVRCGSGWLSAREYLNNLYFTRLAIKNNSLSANTVSSNTERAVRTHSQAVSPQPAPEDTVNIQPLFHPFLRLPQELQEMILMTAAGLSRNYDLLPEISYRLKSKHAKSPISLSALLRISPTITSTMQPYILHRTAFHFGLTGTTNFLWQLGPTNRPHLRRLAFHFGRGALLHCVRWLAPDPIFELLQPPVQKDMGGLPYFWRCQLRTLAKELHLTELIIGVQTMPHTDIAMVARIMKESFGSVEKVSFIESFLDGSTKLLDSADSRLEGVGKGSWRDMTRGYVERYKRQVGWHNYHFGLEVAGMTDVELERKMDAESEFFDG